MARGRAARTVVVTISLIAVVVVAAAVLGVVAQGHPSNVILAVTTIGWPRHFTVADWRRHPDERYYMAFDLAKSGLLRGKSKADVLAMLGKPPGGSDDLVWPVSYPGVWLPRSSGTPCRSSIRPTRLASPRGLSSWSTRRARESAGSTWAARLRGQSVVSAGNHGRHRERSSSVRQPAHAR